MSDLSVEYGVDLIFVNHSVSSKANSTVHIVDPIRQFYIAPECYHLGRAKRIWYLSPMRAAKVQASLRIRAVSPEPSLLVHTSSESRGTFRQKSRSLASLNGLKFWNLSWRNARRHKFAWRGSFKVLIMKYMYTNTVSTVTLSMFASIESCIKFACK